MSSIWDEQPLIHCVGPPGVPLGSPDGFIPNCWAGMTSRRSLNIARYPMIPLGVADFSIEFWHRMSALGGAAGGDNADVGFWHNPVSDANHAFGATWYTYTGDGCDRSIYDDRHSPPGGVTQVENGFASDIGWHHHVVNFDRDGNMELWRDGVENDNVAINNTNLGTTAFASWVGADNDGGTGWEEWHDADLTEFDFKHFNGIIGPVAVHTGAGSLLTAVQMRDSMERRYVNSFATTALLFDWRRPQEVQGWDGNRSNIIRGISDYATIPIAAPEGVDGTIIVPDLSGNDNDWVLTTRPEYNSTGITAFATGDVGLSCCAFGSDPFFKHGGLL